MPAHTLEQQEENGDNTRIQSAQGVVEKGGVPFQIRIPELTQARTERAAW